MAIFPGTDPIIEAARHWKQAFLLNRRGVLEDNEYSAEAFDEIKKRFVDHPIKGDSPFFTKLEEQMKGASPEACGLMAELFWILHLAVKRQLSPEKKRRQIQTIWRWGGSDLQRSRWLDEATLFGVGGPGGGFSMRKWRELGMTVLLFQDWWKLPETEKEELCNDHASFAQWVERKEYSKGRQFRDMLLHLLFPEHFERIFSQRQKRNILDYYRHEYQCDHDRKNRWSVDTALRKLRDELTPKYGEFDFYTTEGANDWRKKQANNGPAKRLPKSPLSLNRIFYGPPGTGKTYHAVNAALEILDPEFYKDNKDNLKKLREKFDELKEEGRVEFVTFHQSFGYEDFIEGLKANADEDGNISFEIEDGVFKNLCGRAAGGENYLSIEQALESLKEECAEDSISMKTVTGKEINVSYAGGKTFHVETNHSGDTKWPVSIERIKRVYLGEDYKKFYNPSYIRAVLSHLRKNYDLGENPEAADREPYVLIIDEINRGNISAIFGELITLIEPSKRKGAEETLSVTLPCSKEPFTVPDNVYLIGTMNTADRSLAILDTALRRRFEFVEMMPNLEILKDLTVGDINIARMLAAINERIEALYDREHVIGHTFFLPLKEKNDINTLGEIFKRRIIPLLQEYFFEDWGKIRCVLNDDLKQNGNLEFIRETPMKAALAGTHDQPKLYRLNDDALKEAAAYRAIYGE